jgi:hypothetical protein
MKYGIIKKWKIRIVHLFLYNNKKADERTIGKNKMNIKIIEGTNLHLVEEKPISIKLKIK